MKARDNLLRAVRDGLDRAGFDAAAVKQEADQLLEALPRARPDLRGLSAVDVFICRLCSPKVAATLDRIDDMAELPAAVARYLTAKGLQLRVALQPTAQLRAIQWRGFALVDAPDTNELVGIGLADVGIAETGSLVFHSGPETPVLAHFLPLHHIVLLHQSSIVMYLDDYAATLRPDGPVFRNINIITGPSGTTDIEGKLVLGAHGPCHLHVVLL
ncbi:MAG: LUD domain-containing protein [Rhizobacter sp.]|nr:LUD domain-containing protein [Rhizobacter sp.]